MPPYDPMKTALVAELLHALDPKAEQEVLGYPDQLRHLQALLAQAIQKGKAAVTPEAEDVMRQVMRRLDPRVDDQDAASETVAHRLLMCVDTELMRWTSAPVQPVGPSGEAVVAHQDKGSA